MGRLSPPGFSDLTAGDRLVLIDPDNSRRVVQVTSVGEGRASGRPVGPNGPEGRVQKIYSGTILGRDGGPEIKCVSNLVAGDLVYTPSHRSGLQYGRIVAGKSGIALLRWDEKREGWLKKPQDIPWDTQWFAHEGDTEAFDRFFHRIQQDKEQWEASSGRSGYRRVEGSDEYSWRAKERRWDLSRPDPTYFRPLSKWERGDRPADPAGALTIGVQVTIDENDITLTHFTGEVPQPPAQSPAPDVQHKSNDEPIAYSPRVDRKPPSVWSRLWQALTK
jgi:hypothetical protein